MILREWLAEKDVKCEVERCSSPENSPLRFRGEFDEPLEG